MALTTEDLQAIQMLLEPINGRFDKIDDRFNQIDNRFDQMDDRFDKLETRAKNIELTQENEVIKAIHIIGEGHAILNRRLDEALKVTSEAEMLQLRVFRLESELRELKDRLKEIEQIA